ncbi:hypothetical protein [Roseicella frigidaeris]|uniref:Uncharacterized protein n=1 Tax=Roseicella frigidaeris TaxID=2230885 RepID=A0A327MCL0_9PROT|nr:hypothetical protein [Roseicella frigidaeris]RAI60255.1 hypothetical protein DOO78_04050 [Roseicella frigidaeris]
MTLPPDPGARRATPAAGPRRPRAHRLAAGLALLPLLGCGIAPPAAAPDPIAAVQRRDGEIVLPDPALLAGCVSQQTPLTQVVLRQDGAMVRPAPGTAPGTPPDFALVVEQQPRAPMRWHLLLGETGPAAEALGQGLDRALGDCTGRLGRLG